MAHNKKRITELNWGGVVVTTLQLPQFIPHWTKLGGVVVLCCCIRIKIHSFIYYKSTQETCMHGYDRAVENNIDFSKYVIVSKA